VEDCAEEEDSDVMEADVPELEGAFVVDLKSEDVGVGAFELCGLVVAVVVVLAAAEVLRVGLAVGLSVGSALSSVVVAATGSSTAVL
jgi:hypothetical protein